MIRWLIPWEPSLIIVAAVVAVAVMYVRGCERIPVSFARQSGFWLSLLLFYMFCHTHFDYYSEHEFFVHRIQHSVLHHIAPFLMALSRPGATLAAGIPTAWRKRISAWLKWGALGHLIDILNNPFIAAFLFCALVLFWLIPSVHFTAMLDGRWYRTMNWSMIINGLMFWNLALNNYCLRPTHLSPATRIAMMLVIIPPQILIGMLIFAAPNDLYVNYVICGRAFGISALADQQIGGLILWIPAAMMSVIGMLVVMRKEWLHLTENYNASL